MKSFSLLQWMVIIILSLLTALEPLSIDLYLPGFIKMSEYFNTPVSAIQISLSTFLAGFAIGQLIWGPLADKYGRKKPILFSLLIFSLASLGCIFTKTVEQLWVVRFIQAIGGCAGVVISRAVVTDYFERSKTLKIFSLLALIMGIAPILAPSIGNGILKIFDWEGLFISLAGLGFLLFLLVLLLLPETLKKQDIRKQTNVFRDYLEILKVKKFVIYSLLAGIVNGALMIYVANGPFLIMEKAGYSGNMFSLIFSINALGLMIGSFLTNYIQRYLSTPKIVKWALMGMSVVSVLLLISMYLDVSMVFIFVLLFFYIFPIGILFPTTTELAITPFIHNSGTASSLFGSIQLAVAFICTVIASFIQDGSITAVGLSFFLCSLSAFILVFSKFNLQEKVQSESF